jgi:error-prone DNA polymerase
MEDFKARTGLSKDELRTLAEIGALNCLAAHRRAALWEVEKPVRHDDLFAAASRSSRGNETLISFDHESQTAKLSTEEIQSLLTSSPTKETLFADPMHHQVSALSSPLKPMDACERLRADYLGMDLTTGPHPMALLRPQLQSQNIWRAIDLSKAQHGQSVRIAGNVICRQRPGTAKGFVFISLEDETGVSNAIVAPRLFERLRLVIVEEPFLLIEGKLQNAENVIVIKAQRIQRLPCETLVGTASHDFH